MNLEEAVGIVLRKAREARGLSQESFGANAGIARTYVSLIEIGSSSATLGTLSKACRWHGIAVSAVIAEAEQLMGSGGEMHPEQEGASSPERQNR